MLYRPKTEKKVNVSTENIKNDSVTFEKLADESVRGSKIGFGGIVNDLVFDVLNVKDFGAVGDGVNDDRPAINSATAEARDNGKGIVFLPPGEYKIGTHIIMRDDVTLIGSGYKTKITREPNSGTNKTIGFAGTKNATLKNMRIDCGQIEEGIELDNGCENIVLENLWIENAGQDGIDLDNTVNSTVQNCILTGCGKAGIHISNNSSGNKVLYNFVQTSGRATENRGAITQTNNAVNNTYIGNKAEDNYRGFFIEESGAFLFGNRSNSNDVNDILTGKSNEKNLLQN